MWTDKLKVGDLIVPKPGVSHGDGHGIIMRVRETNRPTYGAATIDTSRYEFQVWRGGRFIWLQDVEVRAVWKLP
jgi:hypothetical protein